MDRIYSFRPAAVPTKTMSLPMKIVIFSVIGLAVVGAIVGPATYFALAGKANILSST